MFWDSAEVYGYQQHKYQCSSECLLGQALKDMNEMPTTPPTIGSKCFTIPWTNLLVGGSPRFGSKALVEALRASVERLGGRPLDLWSIHFPFPTFGQDVLMDALKEGVESGLTKAVGVSNYNAKQLEEAQRILGDAIPIASNQIKYSMLDRKAEREGLISLANDMDVCLVAYSPLDSGKLTAAGKEAGAKDVTELCKVMEFVGAVNGGKSIAQVALAFVVGKGLLPIPSARSPEQVVEHAAVLDWRLDENEMGIIDEKLAYLKL